MDKQENGVDPHASFDQFLNSFVNLGELVDESGSDAMKEHLQNAEVWLSGYMWGGKLREKVQRSTTSPMVGGLDRFMKRRRGKGENTEW